MSPPGYHVATGLHRNPTVHVAFFAACSESGGDMGPSVAPSTPRCALSNRCRCVGIDFSMPPSSRSGLLQHGNPRHHSEA
eukprot:9443232-Alexandrium_andersonii.AAC.1